MVKHPKVRAITKILGLPLATTSMADHRILSTAEPKELPVVVQFLAY